jgi:hypothetical protein
VPELFPVPFAELSPDDLTSFLDDAEREPLLWEAKGGAPNAHEVRKQCGGFANSARGGYLILGAAETSTGWALDGMVFPDGEPHRYVTTCLQEGVRPVPTYDVRAFEVKPDRHVAVVEVEPLPAGPSIVRGTVYERVAGATIPVKDPGRLAELFARGERAHTRARSAADMEAQAAVAQFGQLNQDAEGDSGDEEALRSLMVVVSVAPVVRDQDLAVRLFRETTRARMLALAEALGQRPPPLAHSVWPSVSQHRRLAFARAALPHDPNWVISASSEGAVSVGVSAPGGVSSPTMLMSEWVVPAYRTAVELVRFIGGAGPVHVDLRIVDLEHRSLHRGVGVTRGPQALDAGALDASGIERELGRAMGIDVPEPEPDSA